MGSSTWFLTKLSQKKNDKRILVFYRYVISALVLIILSFTIIAASTPIKQQIWLGQSTQIIYLAMVFSVMMWLLGVKNKVVDAYGLTVSAEKARVIQRIVALLTILALFILNKLNLFNFFLYNYFIIALLWIFFDFITRRKGFSTGLSFRIEKKESKEYLKDLYRYANPLAVYTMIGLVVGVLDRWLLQKFGGSMQQGFFTLSYKIGAIYFLFASSLTQLITREFSVAFGNNDIKRMKILFRRYIPLIYGIVAYFGCFVAAQSDKIIFIVGGSEYKGAGTVMMIMAFYPLHQTYGQLSGAVFYATGKTKIYRNAGIIGLLLGLVMVYFMLAPADMMGLDAGAVGLAVKMVLIQFLIVNMWLYFNTKLLQLSFLKFSLHQLGSIGIIAPVALLSRFALDSVNIFKDNVILSFLLSGFIYTVLVVVIDYYFPKLFGSNRETVKRIRIRFVDWIKNILDRIKKR